MARMVVIYRTPKDVEAFDRHYFDIHVPLAKKMPGLRKYEISRGPVTVLRGLPDVYLIGTVHFDDLDAMKEATTRKCRDLKIERRGLEQCQQPRQFLS
jgi:uncharacterized protein (TIGR02118 family)